MVVIAADAGGAWTPIGDVTTTMLWIGGQVTTFGVMGALILPSLVTMIVAVLMLGYSEKAGQATAATSKRANSKSSWVHEECLALVSAPSRGSSSFGSHRRLAGSS